MTRLSLVIPRVRTLRYVLIAVVAFSLGAATVVQAVPPGGILGIVQLADRTDSTRLAAVDAAGNVAVSVSNLPATQNVAGTVAVSNLPATQNVSGTVAISNFPATQQVAGSVGDARVTSQIGLDDLTLGASAAVTTPHSTAGYTQARVTARVASSVSCAAPLTIRVFTPAWITPISFHAMQLSQGTLCDATEYNAVFDVPGTELYFSVVGAAGERVIIATWGR